VTDPTDADAPHLAAVSPRLHSEHGRLRTFLIADVRGYTKYTDEFGDEAAGKLAAGRRAGRRVVATRDGFLLELRGDEALVVFVSARQALRAAVELQERFVGRARAGRGDRARCWRGGAGRGRREGANRRAAVRPGRPGRIIASRP
jgi:class 3 adenylate cyclase